MILTMLNLAGEKRNQGKRGKKQEMIKLSKLHQFLDDECKRAANNVLLIAIVEFTILVLTYIVYPDVLQNVATMSLIAFCFMFGTWAESQIIHHELEKEEGVC